MGLEAPTETQYEPTPYPVPSNPAAYQPLYNQPTYQQPQQPQQPQSYQQPNPYPQPGQSYPQPTYPQGGQPYPYQAQPYQATPQYGYQTTAYVVNPPPTAYCVEDTHCRQSNGTGIGWILFIIGFFVPLCWLIGSFFLCSSNPVDRRSGRANLIGLICLVTFLTVFFIASS